VATAYNLDVRHALARILVANSVVLATTTALPADPNATVVQVGERKLSAAEVERRWQALPSFQRRALGASEELRVRSFIDRWLVPELLFSQAPIAKQARSTPHLQATEKAMLRRALLSRVRQDLDSRVPVTNDEVRAYFEAHRELFDLPERLRLYRILLPDQKSAEELIQKLKNTPDFDAWRNTAREKSVDEATRMRGGELGFVSADGHTDVPELQTNPALFAAAARLKDGELAREPIREGDKFAVLWRRGHTPAQHGDLAGHQEAIRAHLKHTRAEAAVQALLSELKAKHVRDVRPEALEGVEFDSKPRDGERAATTTKNVP
jgi:peptidyl-prolyl cis-trans isomerase C